MPLAPSNFEVLAGSPDEIDIIGEGGGRPHGARGGKFKASMTRGELVSCRGVEGVDKWVFFVPLLILYLRLGLGLDDFWLCVGIVNLGRVGREGGVEGAVRCMIELGWRREWLLLILVYYVCGE